MSFYIFTYPYFVCLWAGWSLWRCSTVSFCWGRPVCLSKRPRWRRSSSTLHPQLSPAAQTPELTAPNTIPLHHRKVAFFSYVVKLHLLNLKWGVKIREDVLSCLALAEALHTAAINIEQYIASKTVQCFTQDTVEIDMFNIAHALFDEIFKYVCVIRRITVAMSVKTFILTR